MTLLELAELAEKAEGSDQELDARIWCTLNGKLYKEHWPNGFEGGLRVSYTEPPRRTVVIGKKVVPPYTASVDAALTLVPEGLCLRVGQYSKTAPKWEAVVAAPDDEWWTRPVPMPTAALAVCVAALSARASA